METPPPGQLGDRFGVLTWRAQSTRAMVDATGLIEALGRDDLDQRAVADHLVLLAKVR